MCAAAIGIAKYLRLYRLSRAGPYEQSAPGEFPPAEILRGSMLSATWITAVSIGLATCLARMLDCASPNARAGKTSQVYHGGIIRRIGAAICRREESKDSVSNANLRPRLSCIEPALISNPGVYRLGIISLQQWRGLSIYHNKTTRRYHCSNQSSCDL